MAETCSRPVYRVLRETASRHAAEPALRQPHTQAGRREYLTYTWAEYLRAVEEIACGLRSLGVAKGEVVALDSETRLEFYLADMGIMAAGSVAAAMYPSYPAGDLVRAIRNTGARVAFVENAAHAESALRSSHRALDPADRRSRRRHHA